MIKGQDHPLESLFYPKNIAVVGASPRGGLPGGRWGGTSYLEGSIRLRFRGKLFPVHPTAETILGYPVYPRVSDIPDEVDLVIFSVPSKVVLEVMADCAAKGVKYVHLFTAGFGETGREELIRLEKEMIQIARRAGIRVIGPNCMGLYCPEGGLAWTPEFPESSGPVGLISQSGQLAGHFVSIAESKGVRFSKVVSYGNAGDLQYHEFLDYLAGDEKTKYICSYIEGLKDGRAFFDLARKTSPLKPLIIFKGGRTDGGSRATQSHTASLAGPPKLWEALCRQLGLISVRSLEDMAAALTSLMRMPLPRGRNMAVLGGAGGGSVTMTDLAEEAGLLVPHLAEQTVKAIEEFVPIQGSSAKNPLDIMGAFFGQGPENLHLLMDLLRDDPNIDALIFNQPVDMITRLVGRSLISLLPQMVKESMKRMGKPIFVVLDRGRGGIEAEIIRQELEDRYTEAGLATFSTFPQAARIIGELYRYRQFLDTQKNHARSD
ncbi:MAG: acetate--CoA ligase family protein [Thermodesulfobacteriota bacterium]